MGHRVLPRITPGRAHRSATISGSHRRSFQLCLPAWSRSHRDRTKRLQNLGRFRASAIASLDRGTGQLFIDKFCRGPEISRDHARVFGERGGHCDYCSFLEKPPVDRSALRVWVDCCAFDLAVIVVLLFGSLFVAAIGAGRAITGDNKQLANYRCLIGRSHVLLSSAGIAPNRLFALYDHSNHRYGSCTDCLCSRLCSQ